MFYISRLFYHTNPFLKKKTLKPNQIFPDFWRLCGICAMGMIQTVELIKKKEKKKNNNHRFQKIVTTVLSSGLSGLLSWKYSTAFWILAMQARYSSSLPEGLRKSKYMISQ